MGVNLDCSHGGRNIGRGCLRRIFWPQRDKEAGEWGKLHNEELNNLYCSPNIVRVLKSRRMRWARYVAYIVEGRCLYRILVGKPEGREHLGDTGVDGSITLRWIFRKWDVGYGLNRAGSG